MRVPIRRSQLNRQLEEPDNHLTAAAIRRLRDDLEDIERRQRPKALEDLTRAREMGDLSENAAYSEAKARLGRLDGRIFGIKERLKYAIVIELGAGSDGRVKIGSTVTIEANGTARTFEITGSQETNPGRGRISRQSPLGAALLRKKAGDEITIKTPNGETVYRVTEVR